MSYQDFASSCSSLPPHLQVPYSPAPSYCALPTGYDPLHDDPFSASFVNLDYFKSAPVTPEVQSGDHMSRPSPAHPQEQGAEASPAPSSDKSGGPSQGSSTSAYPIPISNLSLVSPPPHQYHIPSPGQTINYAPMPFTTPSSGPHYSSSLPSSHGFHPYHHQAAVRSAHRLSFTPDHYAERPMSPTNPGLTPSGSRGGSHHQSPVPVSPDLVSPVSVVSSVGSDLSPAHWRYSLPSGPSMYSGTPLSSITNISNTSPMASAPPGLSMVAGLSYSAQVSPSIGRAGSPVPRPRPKMRARASSRIVPNIKKEQDDLPDDISVDDEDEDKGRGGLGLSPATHDSDDRVPVRSQETKKARIESEQRRRDELREGFRKLKEALPHSGQRASKANLLDRSVAHIQLLTAANNSLEAQLSEIKYQLDQLTRTNGELAHALAMKPRGSSGPSPESSGRAVG